MKFARFLVSKNGETSIAVSERSTDDRESFLQTWTVFPSGTDSLLSGSHGPKNVQYAIVIKRTDLDRDELVLLFLFTTHGAQPQLSPWRDVLSTTVATI